MGVRLRHFVNAFVRLLPKTLENELE